MAGVEKILDQIREKAKTEAESILADAGIEAEKIAGDYEAQAQEELAAYHAKAEQTKADSDARARSAADLKKRQALLEAKQEIIRETLDAAYDKLAGLDTAAYFDMLEKLIAKNAQDREGEIFFSAKDLERMPAEFADKLAAAGLKLSRQAGPIENGFILRYDSIEENCSLRAIFDARKDELVDLVHRTLG